MKNDKGSASPIPEAEAIRICDEIKAIKSKKLFTQCWGCVKASKGDFSKMCASSREDFRGCGFVNRMYDERLKSEKMQNSP